MKRADVLCSNHSCRRLWHSAATFGTRPPVQSVPQRAPQPQCTVDRDFTSNHHKTLTLPKPLVEFANKPMIEHQVESLAAAGVTDIVLAVNYRPDVMEAALKKVGLLPYLCSLLLTKEP